MNRSHLAVITLVVIAASCGGSNDNPAPALTTTTEPAPQSATTTTDDGAARVTTTVAAIVTGGSSDDRADVEAYLVEMSNALGEASNRRQACEEDVNATNELGDDATTDEVTAYLRAIFTGCIIGTFSQATGVIETLAVPPGLAEAHTAYVASRVDFVRVAEEFAVGLLTFEDAERLFEDAGYVAANDAVAVGCQRLETAATQTGYTVSLGCPATIEASRPESAEAIIDASGVTVEPAGAIEPGGGVELTVTNTDTVPHAVALVTLFSGHPAHLPVVDGVVDFTQSGVSSDSDELDPDRGYFGLTVPEDMGEGGGEVAPELSPGESLVIGLFPGTYVIFDQDPGGYEAGRYATLVVVGMRDLEETYVAEPNAAGSCERLAEVIAGLYGAYLDEVALLSADEFARSPLSQVDDLRFGAALQRSQELECDGSEIEAVVTATFCPETADPGSAAALILDRICGGSG